MEIDPFTRPEVEQCKKCLFKCHKHDISFVVDVVSLRNAIHTNQETSAKCYKGRIKAGLFWKLSIQNNRTQRQITINIHQNGVDRFTFSN